MKKNINSWTLYFSISFLVSFLSVTPVFCQLIKLEENVAFTNKIHEVYVYSKYANQDSSLYEKLVYDKKGNLLKYFYSFAPQDTSRYKAEIYSLDTLNNIRMIKSINLRKRGCSITDVTLATIKTQVRDSTDLLISEKTAFEYKKVKHENETIYHYDNHRLPFLVETFRDKKIEWKHPVIYIKY